MSGVKTVSLGQPDQAIGPDRFFPSHNSTFKEFVLLHFKWIEVLHPMWRKPFRGCSSVGRAVALQAIGQEFESPQLHQLSLVRPSACYARKS